MKRKIFGMVFAVMLLAAGIAGAEELYPPLFKAPLPEDAVIQPASQEIPAEYAKFLGVWEGNWDWKDLPNRLIVISIKRAPDGKYEADVYYAWGEPNGNDIIKHKRLTGKFLKNDLFLTYEGKDDYTREITYELKSNPVKLDGYYTQNGGKNYSRITVKKVQ
ncbi:MAG: hypothetical protein M1406_03335 [Nitrospirae bacterium]|nr:hypothetical protein [Nitrospirota bacterium]